MHAVCGQIKLFDQLTSNWCKWVWETENVCERRNGAKRSDVFCFFKRLVYNSSKLPSNNNCICFGVVRNT